MKRKRGQFGPEPKHRFPIIWLWCAPCFLLFFTFLSLLRLFISAVYAPSYILSFNHHHLLDGSAIIRKQMVYLSGYLADIRHWERGLIPEASIREATLCISGGLRYGIEWLGFSPHSGIIMRGTRLRRYDFTRILHYRAFEGIPAHSLSKYTRNASKQTS